MRQASLDLPLSDIPNEATLRALVAALLRGCRTLSSEEKSALVKNSARLAPALLADTRRKIRAGEDPLGDAYAGLFSPKIRRETGTTFTPPAVVGRMFELAAPLLPSPELIVDCGAGSGRFTLAALRRHPRARVVASEANAFLALITRANAFVAGLDSRLQIVIGDFRELELPPRTAPALFIGNPPYVRHHDIAPHWKRWYQAALATHGLAGSQLAGLHLHFFVQARLLARPGDVGCFITSAEWLDVNYGESLRRLLLNGLGGRMVHLFPATQALFADALTTSAITTFHVGTAQPGIGFTEVSGRPPNIVQWVPAAELERTRGWSAFARTRVTVSPEATATLGDYFQISRGQVTGLNRVWIESAASATLPASCLFPAITNAHEIISLSGRPLVDASVLRRVVDLPADLDSLPRAARKQVDAFLAWAEREGVRESYVVGHRKPWWRVGLKPPPPIIMTYMGRRPPVFARNLAGARLLNIAHGLYPRQPFAPRTLDALVAWLNRHVAVSAGRTYAGGLVKFEPGEAMRIPVPPPDHFRNVA